MKNKVHPLVFAAMMRSKAQGIKRNIFVCKNCGKAYIRWRRVGEEGKTYCSRECAYEYKANHHSTNTNLIKKIKKSEQMCLVSFNDCIDCGVLFTAKDKTKERCTLCSIKRIKAQNTELARRKNNIQLKAKKCKVCGALFNTYNHSAKCCSSNCSAANLYKHRLVGKSRYRHKRRATIKSAFIENVDIEYLYWRDGGRCQICNSKLNLDRKVPHNLAATIDHIIPLSKGGYHSKANTQLCCFLCNSTKGNTVINGGEQLKLFG